MFFNLFKRKEKKLLGTTLNKDVVEGFIDKIEDIVCVVDNKHKIEYINKPNMINKYNYLMDLLDYNQNQELYNEIIEIAKQEGFYSNNVEIIRDKEKTAMYIAMYYVQTVNKYIVYIKDTGKYFKNEIILKEKLNRSNEELKNKELFVANLSHEIKTPLNIVIAMIYFLKSTTLDETQNEYVNRLESASDLLIELVNNILNVTKSEKVTNAMNTKEKFVLKNLIDKSYDIFKEELERKNVQWCLESNFDLDVEVYADKTRLEQVFINLLSNAVKYTEKGYIELKASKISEDVNSYLLRFCIIDTGVGIKREDTIKIFKEFEQSSDPTIKEKEGFGLGLPLVKKIIESMGGKIWVESSYGLGTKFFFELNLLKNCNDIVEKRIIGNNTVVEENAKTLTDKVLLVDDNRIINEITEKILGEIGIECDVAEDGTEAIRKVEENGINYYGAILMDIHMPKYNGYDISRIMKEDLKVKTPIVALTATNITDSVIDENKNYIHSYIQKPVKPEDLKSIVSKIIKTPNTMEKIKQKRETILLIGNKMKNWEIIENLNNIFNVICTLNIKDINIIASTKKIAALIIDKTEENFKCDEIEGIKNNRLLLLEYNLLGEKQENITLTNREGYIRKVEDIGTIEFIVREMLEKKKKEDSIEDTIEDYNNEITEIYKFLYDSLVNLTSVRSKETGSHLMRTKEYIKIMLREYERSFRTGEFEDLSKIEDIGTAATLHDIGKVGIPDEILNKPGKLTDEEFNQIKAHTIIGYQILKNTSSDNLSNDILEYAKEITLHHHEKYDGTGYPDGLKENEINIISKMMSIIDVYDALVNDRVYKKAMSYEETEDYIISQSGKAFDPKVVNIFMNVKENLRSINEKYKEN